MSSKHSATSRTPEEVLKEYWGYDHFREQQREIIGSVLEGRDTMGLLPTGGGKSICFQVPGLLLRGITLVITPLISLMKDQVDNLRARGIKASLVHSGMSSQKIRQTLDNCLYGSYKFLYISPERLGSDRFREMLRELRVGLIVVDECHCISQWGYDFRPSYLNILDLRRELPDVPLLALTATATPEVVHDIQSLLGFNGDSRFFQKSFYRENLSYSIRQTNDKEGMLRYILERVPGSCIVYCRSRELCRDIAHYLHKGLGMRATFFHAGLTHAEREDRQEQWMQGTYRIMVATNAFGMGIDKPDVRLVVHLTMPSSLEEYFQEAGRAGRDGKRSYAVALVSESDVMLLRRRLRDSFPDKTYILHTYEMLCNYLSVGEGEGLNQSFDFDIGHFIRVCHLRPSQTKPAIDIMALSGWLEYKEEESSSRLMFVYTREELYQGHVGHDRLLRALLRNYTGLFTDYVFINEGDLALFTGYTSEEIYGMLTALSRQGVLHYIPKKNIPRIIFRIRREASRYLKLSTSAYEERQERMAIRIEATASYLTNSKVCRSRQLLSYFGETSELSCGKCDVCQSPSAKGLKHYIIDDCKRYLIDQYEAGSKTLPVQELLQVFPYHSADVLLAVQYLSSEVLAEVFTLVGSLIHFRRSD